MQEVAGLTIVEDGAEDLVVAGGDGQRVGVDGGEHVAGVRTTSGRVIEAKAVVLTTGTFLRGVVHLGLDNYPAGRHKRDRFVCHARPSTRPVTQRAVRCCCDATLSAVMRLKRHLWAWLPHLSA